MGVIIGTLALFIVMSGFSGLRTFSIGFLNTSDPDIKITSIKGKSFDFNADIQTILNQEKGIASYSKVIEERAFLEFKNKTHHEWTRIISCSQAFIKEQTQKHRYY